MDKEKLFSIRFIFAILKINVFRNVMKLSVGDTGEHADVNLCLADCQKRNSPSQERRRFATTIDLISLSICELTSHTGVLFWPSLPIL
jgi:hypothetical protein